MRGAIGAIASLADLPRAQLAPPLPTRVPTLLPLREDLITQADEHARREFSRTWTTGEFNCCSAIVLMRTSHWACGCRSKTSVAG